MLLAIVVLGVALQGGGAALRAAGIVAVPQQYVALAIIHPRALPAKVVPGAAIRFRFSVSSTHESVVRQRWVVRVAALPPAEAATQGAGQTATQSAGQTAIPGTGQVIARGAVSVNPGSTVTVPVAVVMPASGAGIIVTISAPGQGLAPLRFRVATAVAPPVVSP
jgi:hypothetical protein